ncbi:MAG: membrane protein insertase YidC [Acidobacteriota bacterium]|nr:membrane protein insertase YidC [Acidobacteriota bacterium]
MEKRLLLAFVLSAAILFAWSVIFPPPQREQPPPRPAVDGVAEEVVEPRDITQQAVADPVEAPADSELVLDEVFEAELEETVEFVNDDVSIVLSNRGAAVVSYRLLGYEGDVGEPVDLIQTVPLRERALPLQLLTPNGPDEALYVVERTADGAVFRWADGFGNVVEKRVSLAPDGFGLDFEITSSDSLTDYPVSLGTGLRDLSSVEQDSRLALWGEGIMLADGDVEHFKRKKIKEPRVLTPGSVGFVGFEGAYFLGVLRPDSGLAEVRIDPFEYSDGDEKPRQVLRISVTARGGSLSGEYLGAPKEYNLLQAIDQGIEKTLDFGIFSPISVFFLKALHWIYGHVGNYGVAIILLTLGIRILLFPLMHTSTVSMRKMAKVQPKVKEIQGKYKKKKADPQARTKMNQEMMALYKQEGVNPMAGCLPLLVQLPLLWALYQLFLKAIELRHEPFILWITDLSAKDPLYVTPILMTATMWLQQRLAPQAGDPQQQKLMRMMPLIFGIMFLQFPAGLVLYWLTNNVITIIQQEITLHIVGERKFGGRKGSQRKDAKK